MTRSIALLLASAFLATPALAQATAPAPAPAATASNSALEAEAAAVVRKFLDDLAAVARSSAPQVEKDAKVRAIVRDRLDTARIGRFLIGANAQKMTTDQAARYDRLVPIYVADEFGDRIDELAVQNPQIGAVTLRGPAEARVASEFRRKKDKSIVKVDWRLGKDAGGWKLLDVYVNGVSRLLIRRGEFSSVVERQGVEALLKYMESRPG